MTPDDPHWLEAGDPTILGWCTAAAYLLAALFSLRAWWVCRADARLLQSGSAGNAGLDRLAIWWLGVSALMILLGLNKELDLLQKLVRIWGKSAVISLGWYKDRSLVQHMFIALLGLLLAGAGAVTIRYFHRVRAHIALALVGVGLVLAYGLLQAAVFNGMRAAMPHALARSVWSLEPMGVLLVLWCAARACRDGRQSA